MGVGHYQGLFDTMKITEQSETGIDSVIRWRRLLVVNSNLQAWDRWQEGCYVLAKSK